MVPKFKHCVTIVAIAVVVVAVVGTAGVLDASTINSGMITGSGTGGGGMSVLNLTAVPNNDNTVTSSPNLVGLVMTFTAIGPIDFLFPLTNSGGTTEYFFGDVTINNVTGVTWTDFHFELGFGTGAQFTPASSTGDLDFDFTEMDPSPTSTGLTPFTVLNHQATTIDWSGGAGVPTGGVVTFTLSIDVPDFPNGAGDPVAPFTLRHVPTVGPAVVPEPTTLLLLGSGLAGLGALRRCSGQAWWRKPKRVQASSV